MPPDQSKKPVLILIEEALILKLLVERLHLPRIPGRTTETVFNVRLQVGHRQVLRIEDAMPVEILNIGAAGVLYHVNHEFEQAHLPRLLHPNDHGSQRVLRLGDTHLHLLGDLL